MNILEETRMLPIMKLIEAKAENYLNAFNSLSKEEKKVVLVNLLKDPDFREDLIDIAIIEQRKDEPSRPLEEYLKEKNIIK